MKRFIACLLLFLCIATPLYAQEEVKELYAQSAVLMDADSGRVLFEKNGYEKKANASTTKILTCILALELSEPMDVVTVSKEAASQPKVHLGMQEGEQYYMKDLLYSLMLESHNDAAVAIAEHVGGSAEGFAKLMNQKASFIKCENTYFITPNGLDSKDAQGAHGTTAADLARIMRYCIRSSPKREEFLELTRTDSHSFQDVSQNISHLCNNHNAFLKMMDGALTGKTGFTGEAGYCYVGALERDGKTYIVSLLACGWPNNKNYKWSDTKAMMEYGLQYYQPESLPEAGGAIPQLSPLPVAEGQTGRLWEQAVVDVKLLKEDYSMLLSERDQVTVVCDMKEQAKAPVRKGTKLGSMKYLVNGEIWLEESIVAARTVKKVNFKYYLNHLSKIYFLAE